MFDWLKTRHQAFRAEAMEDLAVELREHEDEAFTEALAAAAAMVACADSDASAAEREKIVETLRDAPELAGIEVEELIELFEDHVEAFAENPTEAGEDALDEVVSAIETPTQGRMLVRSVLAVAAADGRISDAEKEAVAQLCIALGVETEGLAERGEPEADD